MWKIISVTILGLSLTVAIVAGVASAAKQADLQVASEPAQIFTAIKESGPTIAAAEEQEEVAAVLGPPLLQVAYVKQPKQGTYCNGTSTKNHPKGDSLVTKITEVYSVTVDYDAVMGWFCEGGFGFGEIDKAYYLYSLSLLDPNTTITSVDDIFDMRNQGMGWGQIMQVVGYAGKSGKPHPQSQTSTSSSSSSSSQGQGIGQTKDKGKPTSNPGKGKGKGKP